MIFIIKEIQPNMNLSKGKKKLPNYVWKQMTQVNIDVYGYKSYILLMSTSNKWYIYLCTKNK